MYWHQLSQVDRYKFENLPIQYTEINGNKLTEADKIRLFLNVNVAGVPQNETHLLKLQQKLREIENE